MLPFLILCPVLNSSRQDDLAIYMLLLSADTSNITT
jgi:hypothetical protein